MKDWNTFMRKWDILNRNVIPYIKAANFTQRKEINILLTDIKSSLKWCRFEDCVNIYNRLLELTK